MNEKIETLEAKIALLTQHHREIRGALNDAIAERDQALIAVCGVKVGDLVKETVGKEIFGRVKRIEIPVPGGRPWVYVTLRKRDGEWGDKERALYGNWKLIEPAERQGEL